MQLWCLEVASMFGLRRLQICISAALPRGLLSEFRSLTRAGTPGLTAECSYNMASPGSPLSILAFNPTVPMGKRAVLWSGQRPAAQRAWLSRPTFFQHDECDGFSN